MAQLRPRVGDIRKLGAELLAIGNGSVEHLRWFVKDQKPDFPAYTDPSLAVYAGAGLKRGVGGIMAPGAGVGLVRALAAGHRQAGIKGDALQQGGVLVVLPGDRLAWRHANRHAADHADVGAILEALTRSGASPSRRKS